MSRRPWYPFYAGDYAGDTLHLRTLEHGAYLLMMNHYWAHGPLPLNERRLQTLVGLTDAEWSDSKSTLLAFFIKEIDCYRHKRIDREIAKADAISAKRRAAGRRAGHARKPTATAQTGPLTPSQTPGNGAANGQQEPSNCSANATANDQQMAVQPQPHPLSHLESQKEVVNLDSVAAPARTRESASPPTTSATTGSGVPTPPGMRWIASVVPDREGDERPGEISVNGWYVLETRDALLAAARMDLTRAAESDRTVIALLRDGFVPADLLGWVRRKAARSASPGTLGAWERLMRQDLQRQSVA